VLFTGHQLVCGYPHCMGAGLLLGRPSPTTCRRWAGQEWLQVEDRQLAVGDRVVCGRNAISQLGVANGTREMITALDSNQRTLTIRIDGNNPKEVTLPGWYLDGRDREAPWRGSPNAPSRPCDAPQLSFGPSTRVRSDSRTS
jgi:hypothetical protein